MLLANNGDGLTSTNTTLQARVSIGEFLGKDRVGWGTVFFGYDNDGYEDLYVASGHLDSRPEDNLPFQPNVLFHNDGDGSFTHVSSISGADAPEVSRRVAYADFNNNRCLGLYVANLGLSRTVGQRAKLFQNSCEWGNNWLIIKTIGTVSNRDGIGGKSRRGSWRTQTNQGGNCWHEQQEPEHA